MTPGDVLLISLPQWRGGPPKLRPALLLSILPGPYQNILVCGVSTQLAQPVVDWDESIDPTDADFVVSGLRQTLVIRLSYLYAIERQEIVASIGQIDDARLTRLLTRLAEHLPP